jgi:cytochrome b pre-mRNA-processing protein 3
MAATMNDGRGGKGAKMLRWLFRQDPSKLAGQTLYSACAKAARNPVYYSDLAVPDTVEGRFELYALHVILLITRIKDEAAPAPEVSQALFDALLRGLDDGLREMGVGDLSVGKKMRKLGEALFGRAKSLDQALLALPDKELLSAFLHRTVYAGQDALQRPQLVSRIVALHRDLAQQPIDKLLAGEVTFTLTLVEGAAA